MLFGFDRTNRIYREMKTLIEFGVIDFEDVLRVSEDRGYDELYRFLDTYGESVFELMLDLIDWDLVEPIDVLVS